MTTKKISDLVELTSFPANGDEIIINDVSEPLDIDKTKRISILTLLGNILDDIASIFSSISTLVSTLVYRRQGGSPSDWTNSGTTTYTPTPADIKIQAGAKSLSLSTPNITTYTFITFPVAFTKKPLVFVNGSSGNTTGVFSCGADGDTVSTTGFYLRLSAYPSQNINITLFWMAIGE